MDSWLIWLIITALLILVELLTGLVATFCIAVGALFSMLAALLGGGLEWQIGSLAVGATLAFIFIAPVIRRLQSRRGTKNTQSLSNMDAIVGRVVDVVEEIPCDGGCGRVRIDGDRWQARCVDGISVPVGGKVRVKGYDSIILEVESI